MSAGEPTILHPTDEDAEMGAASDGSAGGKDAGGKGGGKDAEGKGKGKDAEGKGKGKDAEGKGTLRKGKGGGKNVRAPASDFSDSDSEEGGPEVAADDPNWWEVRGHKPWQEESTQWLHVATRHGAVWMRAGGSGLR